MEKVLISELYVHIIVIGITGTHYINDNVDVSPENDKRMILINWKYLRIFNIKADATHNIHPKLTSLPAFLSEILADLF